MSESVIVFGGAFDPVHNGHLTIAEQVLRQTGMAAVWFVPTGIPPMRAEPAAAAADRLAMVRAAIAGRGRLMASDIEVRRAGVSYTADTMDALRGAHPETAFAMLLGADAARTIRSWHRAADLLAREPFLIVNRSGAAPLSGVELAELGYDVERTSRLEVASPPISASEVRRRVAAGEDVTALLPDSVARLIEERGLYRSAQAVHNARG